MQYSKNMNKKSIETWVFDLDNTLYPPSIRLFDQIEHKMETYMTREIGLSWEDAKVLRGDFWRNHGTTLEGLIQVYGIEPDPFLEEVHDLDHSALEVNGALRQAILSLPGRCVIYTNGSRKHGKQVSDALGLEGCFEAIYGIEDAGYKPKPKAIAFERVFESAKIDPQKAIMFEDDPRNLEIPAQMGMKTVLVGGDKPGDHIHHHTLDLTDFLERF